MLLLEPNLQRSGVIDRSYTDESHSFAIVANRGNKSTRTWLLCAPRSLPESIGVHVWVSANHQSSRYDPVGKCAEGMHFVKAVCMTAEVNRQHGADSSFAIPSRGPAPQ